MSGLADADLTLGQPAPRAQVARALYRAARLTIGGAGITASAEPAVRPRKDARFWQARNRDPRRLFARWDQGVRLDEDPEARFSLTPEDMARYRGAYEAGWDEIRRRRFARQVELGIVDPATRPELAGFSSRPGALRRGASH